ncbi:uncharacterized protein [Nerophis lumbriciformis]|uniref:uncharacterized protein n=1 Tax=Nerophis lumbriciformis TaxID=546530 RepID=UPI003BABE2DA
MPVCCVLGCKNRQQSGKKLKFYRIPTEYRPFQANRRRLWLKVIKQVNGSTTELKESARICGAHFLSGEASMDHDSPDFVPSVFTCMKQSPRPKNQSTRIFGRRGRSQRHQAANIIESEEMPTKADEPEIQGSSSDIVPMEMNGSEPYEPEIQESSSDHVSLEMNGSEPSEEIQSPSNTKCSKAEQTLTEETDTEIKEITSTPLMKNPSCILKLEKNSPVVLLKRILTPLVHEEEKEDDEEEEEDDESSSSSNFQETCPYSPLAPPDAPSFPCNMCDRTFTDNHHLKRHKLLHVKDGRKCPTCGVLFCQLHRHTLFVPRLEESSSESEEDSSVSESEDVPEPTETVDEAEDFKNSWEFIPLLKNNLSISEAHAPTSDAEMFIEMPLENICVPCPVLPEANPSDNKTTKLPEPEAFVEPCLPPPQELPPALQLFSHQFLTSAFFQVKRNYEYIFSKKMDDFSTVRLGNNPCETELDLSSYHMLIDGSVKKMPTAFDLQIVI